MKHKMKQYEVFINGLSVGTIMEKGLGSAVTSTLTVMGGTEADSAGARLIDGSEKITFFEVWFDSDHTMTYEYLVR